MRNIVYNVLPLYRCMIYSKDKRKGKHHEMILDVRARDVLDVMNIINRRYPGYRLGYVQ